MRTVTVKPALTFKKRLFSSLGAACAVSTLLQASPAAAGEPASMRPSAFDASPYVEAGYTSDYLTNHAPEWNSEYVLVNLPLKAFGLLTVQGENVERFGLTDQTISASYAYSFPIGIITLDGRYADNPDFLAKNTVGLVWNGKLPDGLGYNLGAEQRQYEDAKTNIYSLGVEKNIGEFRFAYTCMVSSIDHSNGELAHRMQAQWISASNNRVGVTYSFGIEPEKIDQNTLTSIKTNYVQVNGLFWPVKRVGLVAAYWHGMEGRYYQRNGGQLGLRIVL